MAATYKLQAKPYTFFFTRNGNSWRRTPERALHGNSMKRRTAPTFAKNCPEATKSPNAPKTVLSETVLSKLVESTVFESTVFGL